ncbi:Por secretion system C-terminal sorting domain-containing protein [Flavobacteriaceae bacterium MAR_2010_188]|nr:Por secretion system C-terminal sorting domain-containing protein [Flavobacteriaceae bacterium MAR_2010_188]
MKHLSTLFGALAIVALTALAFFLPSEESKPLTQTEILRDSHLTSLANSPFKNTQNLSKAERYNQGLPPNKYNEQLFEFTMDPQTGRPMPERLEKIKNQLDAARDVSRGAGDAESPWIDRGPNDEGGRTRGIMFDPNDADKNRVFAGGVAGGLWVNDDITNANSTWKLVAGIDGSLSVSVITYDPNNSNIMYIGTGESYTSGDAVGSGIWKSTNGGSSWTKIVGGYSGISGIHVEGVFYINDLVTRDVGNTTEIYAAVSTALFKYADSPRQTMGWNAMGVIKSTDNGASWTRLDIKGSNGRFINPNDIEIDTDNNVWITTTRDLDGTLGGSIYKSTDGTNFTLINTIPNARRTELEISSTDPNKMWIAADISNKVDLFKSTDGFKTFTVMDEPADPDAGVPDADYTRSQAFYNLVIEADSKDNLYVGGINLFKTADNGTNWTQLSKWTNASTLSNVTVSVVHADHHAVVFRPGKEEQIVFGNDGGIYYTNNIAEASTSTSAIQERNKGYSTIQFYYGTLDTSSDGFESFAGGAQDNGTQIKLEANQGSNSFSDWFGGDGGYTEINGEHGYMIQSYYYNDHRFVNYPEITQTYKLATTRTNGTYNGNFINIAELDKNLDIFYSNASNGSTYQIEKISNFVAGSTGIKTEFITNPLLNSAPSAMKISPYGLTTSNLYIGTKTGKLLKVIGGTTNAWTDITGPAFVGSISDIEFGKGESEIFLTMHNYGVKNIWHSADAGATWRSIEGNLPDLPVKCILQNPLSPEEVIIGTDLGIWKTTDFTVANPTWIQSYNGMRDVTVVDLDLRPSDNLILATTHGRGFFTSHFSSSSLGIADLKKDKNNIKLFPTISNGSVFLQSNKITGEAKIEVYNLTGKKLYTVDKQLSYRKIQLKTNLSSGMYLVNISVDNYMETKRMIVH